MGVYVLIRVQSISKMIQFRTENESEWSPIGRRPSDTKHLQKWFCMHGDVVYYKWKSTVIPKNVNNLFLNYV